MELWKPIKGYEGFYEISNKGNARSVERLDARGQRRKSKVISIKSIRGAKQVTLFRDGKRKNFLVKKTCGRCIFRSASSQRETNTC